jgi:hypothetical protein
MVSRPDAGMAGVRALVEMLGRVADPCKARGVRHQLGAVLAVTVFAVLAGARNFWEAGDRALGYRSRRPGTQ